ncbi:hypothetical protein MHYP_G00040360 [Metynnis hypsauchen]
MEKRGSRAQPDACGTGSWTGRFQTDAFLSKLSLKTSPSALETSKLKLGCSFRDVFGVIEFQQDRRKGGKKRERVSEWLKDGHVMGALGAAACRVPAHAGHSKAAPARLGTDGHSRSSAARAPARARPRTWAALERSCPCTRRDACCGAVHDCGKGSRQRVTTATLARWREFGVNMEVPGDEELSQRPCTQLHTAQPPGAPPHPCWCREPPTHIQTSDEQN